MLLGFGQIVHDSFPDHVFCHWLLLRFWVCEGSFRSVLLLRSLRLSVCVLLGRFRIAVLQSVSNKSQFFFGDPVTSPDNIKMSGESAPLQSRTNPYSP